MKWQSSVKATAKLRAWLQDATYPNYIQVISTVFEGSDATSRHIGNLRMQFTATWLNQRHGGKSRDFLLMTTILSIGLRPVASFVHSDSREADVGRDIDISCDSVQKLYPFRASDLQFLTCLHLAHGCLTFLARCHPRIFFIDADGHLIWMLCVWLTGLRTPQEMVTKRSDMLSAYKHFSSLWFYIFKLSFASTLFNLNWLSRTYSRHVMSICGFMLTKTHQIWIRNRPPRGKLGAESPHPAAYLQLIKISDLESLI